MADGFVLYVCSQHFFFLAMFSICSAALFEVKRIFIFILWSNSSYAPTFKNVGFYCDDESLMKPFHGDSIHFMLLLSILLCVFPFTIYLNEYFVSKSVGDVFPRHTFRLLLRLYYTGFLSVLGFTEILKLTFTELRPHFLTTCVPDMKTIKCSDGYITSFNCTGKGQETLLGRDIYKSFPSGHAALSVYAFVFFNVYLSLRLSHRSNSRKCLWLSRSITVISFVWTVVCCISRISDNRHFWWDVLVGVLIGIIAGLISIKAVFTKITALPKENS